MGKDCSPCSCCCYRWNDQRKNIWQLPTKHVFEMSWPAAHCPVVSNRLGVFLKLANAQHSIGKKYGTRSCATLFHTVDTALKWKAIELILLIFLLFYITNFRSCFVTNSPRKKSLTNIHNIQFDSLQLCWVNSLFVFFLFFKLQQLRRQILDVMLN
jgi:hypothetical protein